MSVIRQGLESADLDVPVVLPTLNLDFANSQSLDKRITFSRGSIGTRVNRNGLVETVAANQPRFDFDPISGECKGLLIEESRTNLLTYSEDFSQGVWTKHNSSINSNVITAPDNTSNATKLIENTSNVQHMVYRNLTSAVNTTYTFSFFAKSAERQYVLASFSGGGLSGDCVVGVSLIDGSVTTTSNSPENTSVTKLPNGWYRITLTKTTPSASAFQPRILISRTGSSSQTYQADGTSGIYVWGAQLEAGAFPTSYIPTTTSSVTRSADNASMTGTNFSSWYNQTEGSIYCSYNIQQNIDTITRLIFRFDDLTTNNRIGYYDRTSNNPQFRFEYIDGRALSTGLPDWKIQNNKIACSITSQNSKFSTNGVITNLNTIKTIPALSRAFIGNDSNVTSYLNGTIAKFTYYSKALSPAQLQYLTQ